MKMKQKKCQRGLLLILGCLMLSGCGLQEAPYELSEEERQLIVNYSAHVVSKFNAYQKDGLTYLPKLEEESEAEPIQPVVPEQTVPENEQTNVGSESSTPVTNESEIQKPAAEIATFQSVFAETGLDFTYLGNAITDTYMEDNTYAVNAGYGKNLLVLKLKVHNPTDMPIVLDNLTSGDKFSVNYSMDSGKQYHAKSVMTLLLNDFTTFEGTIEAQTAIDMVIVFEIPSETVSVSNVKVNINKNEKNYQINL